MSIGLEVPIWVGCETGASADSDRVVGGGGGGGDGAAGAKTLGSLKLAGKCSTGNVCCGGTGVNTRGSPGLIGRCSGGRDCSGGLGMVGVGYWFCIAIPSP